MRSEASIQRMRQDKLYAVGGCRRPREDGVLCFVTTEEVSFTEHTAYIIGLYLSYDYRSIFIGISKALRNQL
jgi:hypothetical protein